MKAERAAILDHVVQCVRCRCAYEEVGGEIDAFVATMRHREVEAACEPRSDIMTALFVDPPTSLDDLAGGETSATSANPDANDRQGPTIADRPTDPASPAPYSTLADEQTSPIASGMRGVAPWSTLHDVADRSSSEPARTAAPKVPGYELISKLGQGGMGVVYLARQRRLNRLVALKMIRDNGQAGPQQLARFYAEAQAVALLRHPNIVQIHEIGEVGGLPYFSLELLEGGSLEARLGGEPQPGRDSAEMVATLALAIQAAHAAGVVHRDLKPANVVLAGDGTPKITDFGLAKRLEEEDASHTNPGEIMGSPNYMAPEQAFGKVDEIGPPADIYALGTILYEMLTGRPPFRGTSPWETIRLVREEEPVAPSKLQPRLSRDLETICLKCLAKDPRSRYASALDLAEELRRFLDGVPIRARPVPFWTRGAKWARRRPAVASLLALGATVACGLVGFGILYAQHIQREKLDREKKFDQMITEWRDVFYDAREYLDKNPKHAVEHLDGLMKKMAVQDKRVLADKRVSKLSDRVKGALLTAKANREASDREEGRRKELDAFKDRYRRFELGLEEVLFLNSDFLGIEKPPDAPAIVASKTLEALGFFAASTARGVWSLTPPGLATPEERRRIVEGCYELLLILADAEIRATPSDGGGRREDIAGRYLRSAANLDREALPDTVALHRLKVRYHEARRELADPAREQAVTDASSPRGAFDHFLLGCVRFKDGDMPSAIFEFRASLHEDAQRFWARCLLAAAEMRRGQPKIARDHLDLCVDRHANQAILHMLRGYASGMIGLAEVNSSGRPGRVPGASDEGGRDGDGPPLPSPSPSVDRSADGLDVGPGAKRHSSNTWFADAEVDFTKALSLLDAGERTDPDLARSGTDRLLRYATFANRGLVRLWDNRREEAAADLGAAIEIEPGRFNAHNTLAELLRMSGEHDEAIARLTEAIDQGPGAVDLAALRSARAKIHADKAARSRRDGRFQDEAKERRAALEDFDAVLGRPGISPAELADVSYRKAELLSWAARRGPDPGERESAERTLIACYRKMLGEFASIVEVDPANTKLHHWWRVRAYLELKQYDEALIGACNDYLALDGSSAAIYKIRGQVEALLRHYPDAIRDLTRSLELQPGQAEILTERGWARFFLGEPSLAFGDFEAALKIDASNSEALAGRGNVWAAWGKGQEALSDADKALKSGKPSFPLLFHCALIFARVAVDEVALAHKSRQPVSTAARQNQENAKRLFDLAMQHQAPGDRDPFLKFIRKNISFPPHRALVALIPDVFREN